MDDDARWFGDEVVRGFLGWFVIPASLLALAAVWIVTMDGARADGMSRWLQAIVIAILGFYFGNADASWARRRARRAEQNEGVLRGAIFAHLSVAARAKAEVVRIGRSQDELWTEIRRGEMRQRLDAAIEALTEAEQVLIDALSRRRS